LRPGKGREAVEQPEQSGRHHKTDADRLHTSKESSSSKYPPAAPSVSPSPIPVLATPKRVLAAFERLRSIRTYPDAQRAHIGTKDALNNEVKLAFGQGDLSWKPGHLRSAYGAICCHRFKPRNMTDDIFLAQILGHKLLGPNASLSVGQSYKDFYVVGG
jgi:Telomere resolvase